MEKVLDYRDTYISVFFDSEKLFVIFVNDRGHTKVLNIDDNFYCVEENILAYKDLIEDATDNVEEQRDYLGTFINYVMKHESDLDFEYLWHCGVYCETILRKYIEVEHEESED